MKDKYLVQIINKTKIQKFNFNHGFSSGHVRHFLGLCDSHFGCIFLNLIFVFKTIILDLFFCWHKKWNFYLLLILLLQRYHCIIFMLPELINSSIFSILYTWDKDEDRNETRVQSRLVPLLWWPTTQWFIPCLSQGTRHADVLKLHMCYHVHHAYFCLHNSVWHSSESNREFFLFSVFKQTVGRKN